MSINNLRNENDSNDQIACKNQGDKQGYITPNRSRAHFHIHALQQIVEIKIKIEIII